MILIDLASKFDPFEDHWHPRVVASLNGQDVKIAKILGRSFGTLTRRKTNCFSSSKVR